MTSRLFRFALWSAIVAGAVALGAGAISAQRDQPNSPLGTGTAGISGTVVDAVTGRPLVRARVTLTRQSQGRVTLTDADGKFQFPQIPAASYELGAALDPYLPTLYGQKKFGRPGTPVVVAERQQLKDISIGMLRGGVVTGVMIDPAGQPLVKATIRALRWRFKESGPALDQAESAITDDRGEYRIFPLEPGDYLVLGEPRTEVLGPRLGVAEAVQPGVMGIAPSFHPGTPVATQATTVTVAPGEVRAGIDIVAALQPLVRISGSLLAPNGQLLSAGSVELFAEGEAMMPAPQRRRSYIDNGRFAFIGLSPGSYDLTVLSTTSPNGPGPTKPGSILYGVAHVLVSNVDVNDLTISMQPGVRVSGRIRVTGTGQQASPATLHLSVHEIGPTPPMAGPSGPMAVADASGTFSFNEVPPGRFSFFFLGLGPGKWFLQSATHEGEDVLNAPLVVGMQDVSDIVLTFTDTPTEISGTATTATGRPLTDGTVIVFPGDKRVWTTGVSTVKTASPDADGRYRLPALPPGDFLIAAVEGVEQFQWFDPRFLEQLAPRAERIRLAPGEKRALDLRALSIR